MNKTLSPVPLVLSLCATVLMKVFSDIGIAMNSLEQGLREF